ncbi:MAG: S-layer homology domain-containing protein [Oscillospiraceae bacterium]|nr:S-layer homology domain-containing protein [Oscillospiraceae bacterium]
MQIAPPFFAPYRQKKEDFFMYEKKVGKRLLTWVLVLVMTLSLLPLNVLAVEGDPATDGGAAATDDKLHFTKEATLDPQTGEIIVHMEAWATGEVTTSTSTEALDIVLVLDVSGSMKEDFIQEKSEFVPVYNLDKEKTYYVEGYYNYHEVTWCADCNKWTRGCMGASGWHVSLGKYEAKTNADDSNSDHEQLYEYSYTPGQNKLDALKGAVKSFIDNVATKSPGSRISIVKFAGDKSSEVGNDMYFYGNYNRTQIVKKLTAVTTSGAAELKAAVNALNYGGATAADYGIEKAQEALSEADTSHKKVVVLFTDGEPNHQNGFDYSVAAATINTARTMKTDTTIYTIGVFREPDNNVDTYMSSTSSNYPSASAATQITPPYWTVTDGGYDLGDYYKKVNNADDLLKAFETVSSEVTPGTALGSTAVLTDVIAPNCSLVVPPEGTSAITAYTVDKTANRWSTTSTLLEGNAVTVIGQEVLVTGFDYSANCVTATPKPNTSDDYGKKLVVEFKVQNNNYGGTQPTNASAAIKDANGSTVKSVDNPTVPAQVKLPTRTEDYTVSKVYDGEGYDIKENIAGLVTGLVPVNSTNNAYVDLTYTIKDSTGATVGTYTIPAGQTTGTWDGTSDIKTPAGVGDYTYTVTVTGTDKEKTENSGSQNYDAKFSITAKPVTFTGETDTKQWTGSEQSITGITVNGLVAGHNYEGLTYCAKGTTPDTYNGEFSGEPVIKDAEGNVVTTNYQVTKTPGTLTITNSTSTAIVTFKIDGGTWADGGTTDKTAQVTLTNGTGTLAGVTIPTGAADNDHEGAGVWKNASGNEVTLSETTTITGDTTYTLTFKANEVEPTTYVDVTVNYYKDSVTTEADTNCYLDKFIIKNQPVDSTITIGDVELNLFKPTTGGYMNGVQQGTVPYTVQEEDNIINVLYTKEIKPDTILGVLNKYVQKQFNSTYGYPTTAEFTVDAVVTKNVPVITNASEGQIATQELSPVGTYTGTVSLSAGTSKLFGFSGTEDTPLYANTNYQVTVKERDANLSYVTCDTAEYRFNFTTDANGKVNNIQGVTITNTYYYKPTYRPPTPTVVIPDDDALGLNTTDHFAYIVGYGNGEVRPQNNITRAEVATIFFRLLTDDVRDENLTKTNRYSDVAATSWYNTAVSTLSSMGIITGYPDGTFRPNAAITRAEFAAIAARFDNDGDKTAAKFSDIANHWAKDEISIAYNNGWITGYPDGTFGPQRDITRAETMTLVNRVLNRQPETEDDLLPNMTVWTDNANPKAWYYLAVQEATNSHYYKFKTNSKYEKWTELRETRDWTQLEK